MRKENYQERELPEEPFLRDLIAEERRTSVEEAEKLKTERDALYVDPDLLNKLFEKDKENLQNAEERRQARLNVKITNPELREFFRSLADHT